MRTTLVLDDALVREARRRAAERQSTLSDFVNDALRHLMSQRAGARRQIKLPTAGDARRKRRISPREIAEVLAENA